MRGLTWYGMERHDQLDSQLWISNGTSHRLVAYDNDSSCLDHTSGRTLTEIRNVFWFVFSQLCLNLQNSSTRSYRKICAWIDRVIMLDFERDAFNRVEIVLMVSCYTLI